ncbi:MAG: AAA family ATPase, partial [Bacteroidales bacterium]|nr:AAA family ATPase [Bacteroidales bacterium]
HWEERLIGIKGARGVGKTTLILQYIKKYLSKQAKGLYVSLDDIYFYGHSLVEFVDNFVKKGGTHLFLDEVHRYKNWAIELKNIYDDHPNLKVVFTGSSMLHLAKARGDLSRRAKIYTLHGLSYREYLNFITGKNFKKLAFRDILKNHVEYSNEVLNQIRPLQYFEEYLKSGIYPFFIEYPKTYQERLASAIDVMLEIDLPAFTNITPQSITSIKKLLYVIANSVPFKPNIQKISEKTGIYRNTLITYLGMLRDAGITNHLFSSKRGVGHLQKPEKIYLNNTNLIYALAEVLPEKGSIRETFFMHQLSNDNSLTYTQKGDFFINGKYTFEVGGKYKTRKQIIGISDAFLAADDIEIGYEYKIPLWLFGFIY